MQCCIHAAVLELQVSMVDIIVAHPCGGFGLLFMHLSSVSSSTITNTLYPPQLLLSKSVPDPLYFSGVSLTIHSRIVS